MATTASPAATQRLLDGRDPSAPMADPTPLCIPWRNDVIVAARAVLRQCRRDALGGTVAP